MNEPVKRVPPVPMSVQVGDPVLYTPPYGGGSNGATEYYAVVGQIVEEDGREKYHLIYFPPFQRYQWATDVPEQVKGRPTRHTWRRTAQLRQAG